METMERQCNELEDESEIEEHLYNLIEASAKQLAVLLYLVDSSGYATDLDDGGSIDINLSKHEL